MKCLLTDQQRPIRNQGEGMGQNGNLIGKRLGLMIPAFFWMCLLLLLPACQRYFTLTDRVVGVVASIITLLLLLFSIRGWRVLYTLPIWAVIVYCTIGLCMHPYYNLIDYLLHDAGQEEKSAYYTLAEIDAGIDTNHGHISSVRIENAQVSDKSLNCLKVLPKLRFLVLSSPNVTNSVINRLEVVPSSIEILDLSGTQISDDGLICIKKLKQLQLLKLETTKVSDAGVAELQKALPNCDIRH